MKRLLPILAGLAVIACLATDLWAQSGIDLFQKALAAERADGNLREAIQLYQRVIAESGRDRALAARALLRMAQCYDRLGDAQARTAYERLIREFADQPEATAARAEIARPDLRTAQRDAAMNSRRLLSLPKDADLRGSSISLDGRFLAFTDWASGGDLVVRDLTTGRSRTLSTRTHAGDYIDTSAMSRDGKTIAYMWFNGAMNRNELRLASIDAAGPAQSRLLYVNPEVRWLQPLDWSPDGRWIAVQLTRPDRSGQLGLISAVDGSLRVLKSSDWLGTSQLFFSPDGRQLALDVPVGGTATAPRDVFLLAVDGSRETPVVVGSSDDTVLGWSPDGKQLLFASDRSGGVGLWMQPMSDDRPAGSAQLIKTDVPRRSFGVGAGGALYLGAFLGGREIHVGSIDWDNERIAADLSKPIQAFAGFNVWPAWSPDGRALAYLSRRDLVGGSRTLAIKSFDTGEARDLNPALNYVQQPQWSPDGRSLIVNGRDARERPGIFRIDVATSVTTRLTDGASQDAQLSPDGTTLYFRARRDGDSAWSVVERDVASGAERILFTRPTILAPILSPDGRAVAVLAGSAPGTPTTLILLATNGGAPRELWRMQPPHEFAGSLAWARNGRSVLVARAPADDADNGELLQVAIDGGGAKAIPSKVPVVGSRGVALHPDGQRLAFVAGENKSELWVLENFLPAR